MKKVKKENEKVTKRGIKEKDNRNKAKLKKEKVSKT